MMMRFDKSVIGVRWIVIILVVACVGLVLAWSFFGPNNFSGQSEIVVHVSRGESLSSIVDSLQAQGVIRSRFFFELVARVVGGEKRIQVGKYVFQSGISNIAIFRALREGAGTALIPVTIPEGLRSRAQAHILSRVTGLDSARYVDLAHDESFIRSLGIDASSLEGYLFPETYILRWQPDERDVLREQVDQFKRVYGDSLQARAKKIGLTTNQVLTMASIVEGETVLPSERATIAGVYYNRLRKRMRLEADPTVQFMIGNGPRRVYYSDLRKDSPYNTYLHTGLPPGPINSPGKASILAALYPAKHNYLYFVANGTGGHWFSSSYADHSRYVRKYRRQRAQNRNDTMSQVAPQQRASSK